MDFIHLTVAMMLTSVMRGRCLLTDTVMTSFTCYGSLDFAPPVIGCLMWSHGVVCYTTGEPVPVVESARRHRLTDVTWLNDPVQCITTIIGRRRHQTHEDSRSRVLDDLSFQQPCKSTKIGLLNTQSIGNKFTIVSDCILSNDFNFFAAVETWHDLNACSNLVACTPFGYRYVEEEHTRSGKAVINMKSNQGGVCLFYKEYYAVRTLKLLML